MRRTGRLRVAVAAAGLVLATFAAVHGAAPASAASPWPTAAASADPGGFGNIEVWLDRALATDTPAGGTIAVGLTMWDTKAQRLPEFNKAYVRLHPAKGSAKPTVGTASSDWPGHLVGEVVVPKGGAGKLEIGLFEKVCTTRGSVETCKDKAFPFRMAGTGPPPDAPRSALVVATTEPPAGALLAGQPVDIRVTVEPQAGWDLDALGLPDQLVAIVSAGGGPDVASTLLNDTGRSETSPAVGYLGQITVDEPGDYYLVLAFPGNGSEDQVLRGATTPLEIGGTAVVPDPETGASGKPVAGAPSAVATGDGGPPWLVIGAIVAGLAIIGFAIRKVFADL